MTENLRATIQHRRWFWRHQWRILCFCKQVLWQQPTMPDVPTAFRVFAEHVETVHNYYDIEYAGHNEEDVWT